MTRQNIGLFLALLIGVMCSPNSALAKVTTDFCGDYPDQLSAADINWLRFSLRERFPAKYSDTLQKIRIDEVDDPALLGPQFVDAEDGSLILPRRFLQQQCKMALLQSYFLERPEADYAKIELEVSACIGRDEPRAKCLEDTIDTFLETRQPIWSTAQEKERFIELVSLFAFNGATFLLAHEAGHAVIRRENSPGELALIDEEFEADSLALLSVVGDLTVPIGPIAALATMSLAEGESGALFQTHDSANCRLDRTQQTLIRTAPDTFRILTILTKGADSTVAPQQATKMSEIANARLLRAADGRKCPDFEKTSLGKVADDLTQTISVIGEWQTAKDKDIVDLLSGLELRTDAGRRFMLLTAFAMMGESKALQRFRKGFTDTAMERETVERMAGAKDRLAGLAGGNLENLIRSSELSSVMMIDAMGNFFLQPPGSGVQANNKRLVQDLGRAFAVLDPYETMNAYGYGARYMPRLVIRDEMSNLGVMMPIIIHQTALLALGECERAGFILSMLRMDVALSNSAFLNMDSNQFCRAMQEKVTSQQINENGWVWDGPPLQSASQ